MKKLITILCLLSAVASAGPDTFKMVSTMNLWTNDIDKTSRVQSKIWYGHTNGCDLAATRERLLAGVLAGYDNSNTNKAIVYYEVMRKQLALFAQNSNYLDTLNAYVDSDPRIAITNNTEIWTWATNFYGFTITGRWHYVHELYQTGE